MVPVLATVGGGIGLATAVGMHYLGALDSGTAAVIFGVLISATDPVSGDRHFQRTMAVACAWWKQKVYSMIVRLRLRIRLFWRWLQGRAWERPEP